MKKDFDQWKNDVSDLFQTLTDVSKSATHRVLHTSSEWVQTNSEDARKRFAQSSEDLKVYFESESFEKDLDHLARRLGIEDNKYFVSEDEDRKLRLKSKVKYLYLHCFKNVAESAGAGGIIGELLGRTRAAKTLSIVFGLGKLSLIGFHVYDILLSEHFRKTQFSKESSSK